MDKPPTNKKKQGELPTLETQHIPELEEASEAFRVQRDLRMAAMKPEKEAKTKLLELMKKLGLKTYRYEGENAEGEVVEFDIERESKENVKVRTAKESDEEGEDPDAE